MGDLWVIVAEDTYEYGYSVEALVCGNSDAVAARLERMARDYAATLHDQSRARLGNVERDVDGEIWIYLDTGMSSGREWRAHPVTPEAADA